MSILKEFFKNIGFIGIANAAVAIKGLLLIPVILKSLGEADFGIWAQLLVTLYLLIPFTSLHLGLALVRFVSAKKDTKEISKNFSTILTVVLVWSSFLSLIFVTSSKFVLASFIDLSEFDDYLILIGVILPLWSVNLILYSYFRTRLKFKAFAAFAVFHNAAEIVFISGMIFYGFGIYGALLGLTLTFTVVNIIQFIIIVNQIGFSRPDTSFLKKYLAFSLPLVPLEMFWWIADSSDKYITGFYMGPFAVGIYAAVYGLSRVVNMFAIPLTFVLGPTLARYYDTGKLKEVKKLLGVSIRIFIMFSVPIVVGFTVLAKPLLLLLATEEVSDQGAILVPIITTGMLLYGISAIFGQVIILVKKTYVAGIIWGFAAGLNVFLNIILIPPFGLIGPAVSTLFTFGLASLLIIAYTRTHLVFGLSWWFMAKCLGAGIVMGLLLWLSMQFSGDDIFSTLILIVLGFGTYFGLLYLLRAFGEKEKEFLKTFMK